MCIIVHRFIAPDMGAKGRILIVAWTLHEKSVPLISAWKASQPKEDVMSNNSDRLFDRYAEMDFSDAKPVPKYRHWRNCKPNKAARRGL